MNEKILIVHNIEEVADSIADALRSEGYEAAISRNGDQGLALAREDRPAMVLLDAVLPGIGGHEVCRLLRAESSVPIIYVSAIGDEFDRVHALELGADDYITIPFSMRELIARVKANLRRVKMSNTIGPESVINAGDVDIDCERRMVHIGDKAVYLALKEFELLKVLICNCDRVVTRETLLNSVWGEDATRNTRTLDVHIRWLRKKIPNRITTIRGIGYRLSTK